MLWFDGLKPSKCINLHHLRHTKCKDDDYFSNEIWVNEKKGKVQDNFIMDEDGGWAICDELCILDG
jgi:hypothetical protein